MKFEWDEQKAWSNLQKHQVSFEEALTAFYDENQVVFYDPNHSHEEDRELLIGYSKQGRLLFISYTLRNSLVRIISARKATKQESKKYASRI